jgi:hypothetical protein
MIEILVGLALFVGGYLLGHWAATQSNRQSAEYWARFVKTGSGEAFQARSYTPETAEMRIDKAAAMASSDYTTETVARGVEDLTKQYQAEGVAVPSADKLAEEVRNMLAAAGRGDSAV